MRRLRLAVWVCFLVATLVVLHSMGGRLAPPPLSQPGGLDEWFAERRPAEAAFAAIRLVTLGLAWYLVAVTVLGTAARLLRLSRLTTVTDLVTVPAVRRLVNGAVGLTTMAATALGGAAGSPGLADEPPAVETMRRLPDEVGQPATPPPSPPAGESMRRLPDPPGQGGPPGPPRSWTVRPGDHFWAVAERVLAEAWRRAPSDAEVTPYWQTLVEANRDRLRDRDNPDLLFPGQVVVVPTPPGRPS